MIQIQESNVRSSRSSGIGLISAFLMTVMLPAHVIAKDSPETTLLREGKIYEAAQLLQKRTKDEAAQRSAATLYFQLALYDKAAERLASAGVEKTAAISAAIAEAFSQGNRAAALRFAEANGAAITASAKAEYARRELAEGRAGNALALALGSGDDSLIAAAGVSAFDEAIGAGPVVLGYRSTEPRRLRFSPDGRFILIWNEAKTEIETIDTCVSEDRPTSERGRIIDKSVAAGGFAMNADGRYLAIIGLAKDKAGKDALILRVERLDTGFVARSIALSGRFPKGQASALVYAGDLLCAAFGKSLVLFDPWSGEVKASATAEESVSSIDYLRDSNVLACWSAVSGMYRAFDAATLQPSKRELSMADRPMDRFGLGGAGQLYDKERNLILYVPSSSAEDLRVAAPDGQSASKTGPLSLPLVGPKELRYSGGVDAAISPSGRTVAILAREGVVLSPFPFLDREETAARLAKEFGATARFAPLCGHYVDEGRLDEAKRLWTLAGVDERDILLTFADSKLRRGDPVGAAADLLKAGEKQRALDVASGMAAQASSGAELAAAYAAGKAIYDQAGADAAPLALAAGRKAVKFGEYAAALEYFATAAAREEIENLAFDPKLASVDWCLKAGSLLGMAEPDILSRAAAVLEAQKKWSEAASAYFRLRNDEGLGRAAKAALSGSEWDHKLLDVLKARADPGFCRAAAELLVAKGELVYAVEQYAAVGDLQGVARVADKALDADDFVFAADLYSSLGSKTAKAATAARLKLVYDEASAAIAEADSYISQETIDGVNAGRIAAQWPIPASKSQEPAYQQMKRFGDALVALRSAPRAAEIKRCAAYLSKDAIKATGVEGSDRAKRQLSLAARFTFSARLLSAMGK